MKEQHRYRRKLLLRAAFAAAVLAGSIFGGKPAIAQDVTGGSRPSTVLPTDILPLPLPQERQALGESMKLRLFQKLPARFYFQSTTETTFRYESNVFQTATQRTMLRNFAPDGIENLPNPETAIAVENILRLASNADVVYRITPNVTAGWSLTPNTRVYVNYFFLRDKLARHNVLNTYINQLGLAIEHSRPVPKMKNTTYELQFTARELWQKNVVPVFDYLPSLTLSRYFRTTSSMPIVGYFNALLQMRSTKFIELPNRNITPFFTIGAASQKGKWAFSVNATMLYTFQKDFPESRIGIDSGSWILDFEIARQILTKVPGFQAFCRAEPVYNFAGRDQIGLSGMDFRMYFGVRFSAYKPSLLGTMQMLQQHYRPPEPKQQKQPKPKKTKPETKPEEKSPEEQKPDGKPGEKDPKQKKKTQPGGQVGFERPQQDLRVAGCVINNANFDMSDFNIKDLHSFNDGPIPLDLDETASAAITQTAAPIHGFTKEPLPGTPLLTPTPAPMHGFRSSAKPVNELQSSATPEPTMTTTPAPIHGFMQHSAKLENKIKQQASERKHNQQAHKPIELKPIALALPTG